MVLHSNDCLEGSIKYVCSKYYSDTAYVINTYTYLSI